jgi:hypothetical protein
MAASAHGDNVVEPVGGKQRRLPPDMCCHPRALTAAYLAGELIPFQHGRLGIGHARPVIVVQPYVECHARHHQHGGAVVPAQQQEQHYGGRVMQRPGRGMSGRVRIVEGAYRGGGIQAAMAHQEPQVMVGVNEDARSPRRHDRATQERVQHRGRPARQDDMVSNAHGQ